MVPQILVCKKWICIHSLNLIIFTAESNCNTICNQERSYCSSTSNNIFSLLCLMQSSPMKLEPRLIIGLLSVATSRTVGETRSTIQYNAILAYLFIWEGHTGQKAQEKLRNFIPDGPTKRVSQKSRVVRLPFQREVLWDTFPRLPPSGPSKLRSLNSLRNLFTPLNPLSANIKFRCAYEAQAEITGGNVNVVKCKFFKKRGYCETGEN